MRALVVYESMFGNTRLVASSIADGLRAGYEVTVVPVAQATPELVAAADLLLAGAPTHMRGLPSPASRRRAAQTAARDGSGLRLEADAGGPGMRTGCRISVTATAWPPRSTPGSTASPCSPGGPAAG